MSVATPRLDEQIERLAHPPPPPLYTVVGVHVITRRLHLKRIEISGRRIRLQHAAALALLRSARDLAQRHKSVVVVSSYRSWAEQARLYAAWVARHFTGLPAAKPGTSYHNIGLAIDISGYSDKVVRGRLGAHGWNWLGSRDPVHFSFHVHG